jgi:hypothetical protein
VGGLQAQVLSAAWLGLRARSPGIKVADLDRALNEQRSIVRSWLMRGTLHVVAAPDFRWLLQLLGPVFVRAGASRRAQLGLTDTLESNGIAAIRRIVTDAGPLTRSELVDRLRKREINLDPKTQAPIHLIQLAALQGILCLGPDRDGGESTYVLLDDWVRPAAALPRDRALGELARRYFSAYGPATVEDLAAWSGISIAEARAAVAGANASLSDVTIQGKQGFILKDRRKRLPMPARSQVRLLPAFDTYLLGYRRRDFAVPALLQRRLQRGGGWLHPAVVVSGRAVGAWRLRKSGGRGHVEVELFGRISAAVRAGIETEVADIGRFLDLHLRVNFTQSNSRSGPM